LAEEESMKQLRVRVFSMLLATIVIGTISLSFYDVTAISQERKLPEPASIGVFYFLDSPNNSLLSMERQVAVSKMRGLLKEQFVIQLQGEKSTFRLRNHQKMEFVVSLFNGVDPNNYRLFLLNVKQGKRELILAEATLKGSKSNFVQVPFDVTKFGEAYKYAPSQALSPGEYAFFRRGSNDAFLFGVDAPKEEENKKPN
jgi:hypothetical protein